MGTEQVERRRGGGDRRAQNILEDLQNTTLPQVAGELRRTQAELRRVKVNYRVAGIIGALAVLFAFIVVYIIIDDRASDAERRAEDIRQNAITQCETGNASRVKIANGFDTFRTVLISASQQDLSPAEKAKQAETPAFVSFQTGIDQLVEELKAPRDCQANNSVETSAP